MIEPFQFTPSQAAIDDLGERLSRTRWPEAETEPGWGQGAPLAKLKSLCAYWARGYDWRGFEARLNRYPQFRTVLDGLGIHFVHARSPHPQARPLLLTHGWPGAYVEFLEAIAPLTDPTAHGGAAEDAFHVVAPSLPGLGFSDRPADAGWTPDRIARAWAELMARLGYDGYLAQGGDWGAVVTHRMAALEVPGLAGVHFNMLIGAVPPATGEETPAEQAMAAVQARFQAEDSAYLLLQATRPQTLAYGLADSPVAQAAWIYEKLQGWSDSDGDVERLLGRDAILDLIGLYWLTATGGSSARLYREARGFTRDAPIRLPAGVSLFPKEFRRLSRRWAEAALHDIVYWNELEAGGHFAAFEQPALFVEELRRFGRALRRRASAQAGRSSTS